MNSQMKIRIKKNVRRKYFWDLVARNGRICCVSEDYSSRAKCIQTATKLASIIVGGCKVVDA
jgi:uncharacterized protein YegP (UPF0339 family)